MRFDGNERARFKVGLAEYVRGLTTRENAWRQAQGPILVSSLYQLTSRMHAGISIQRQEIPPFFLFVYAFLDMDQNRSALSIDN